MNRRRRPLATALAATLGLAANATGAAQVSSVAFIGMPAPSSPEDLTRSYSTAKARITYSDGSRRTVALRYHTLFTNLDKVGSSRHAAGQLYNAQGEPLHDPLGKPVIAETPDANSLLAIPKAGRTADGRNKLYLVTHYEYDWLLSDGRNARKAKGWYSRMPMSMTLTTVAQDADGALAAVAQRPIDFSGVHGLWIPCAASQTPWNTHLGGEEDYELFKRGKADKAIRGMTELYFGGAKKANPYRYGYVTEVRVTADGETHVEKHYAMGRAAWEKAEVMPDQRTVYMGDDGAYTGLFMFLADRAGDLSAGTLYAARWQQRAKTHGGSAGLLWIRLGHASDAELDGIMDKEVFAEGESSIFEFAEAEDGQVPAGFQAIRAGLKNTTEYIRLRDGKAKAAAFLDSRRYAAYLGATTEFNKMEAVAVDADKRQLYIAMSYIENGMAAEDGGPRDHIRVTKRTAGGVYRLNLAGGQRDSGGEAIDSAWVATDMSGVPELMGVDLPAPDALGNTADPERVANPDNVAFSEKMRTLFVGEDSSTHSNNFVWAFNVDTGQLSRILSVPMGAEATGLQVVENINGHAYVMSNYQHAGEKLDERQIKDPGLKQAVANRLNRFEAKVGYLGGLPGM